MQASSAGISIVPEKGCSIVSIDMRKISWNQFLWKLMILRMLLIWHVWGIIDACNFAMLKAVFQQIAKMLKKATNSEWNLRQDLFFIFRCWPWSCRPWPWWSCEYFFFYVENLLWFTGHNLINYWNENSSMKMG